MLVATSHLDEATLRSARVLMDLAFDDFSDDDWAHALGGMHSVIVEDDLLLAHGSLVGRRLWLGDTEIRAGYVEAVAARPDRQREGLASRVMADLEGLAGCYDLLALSASDAGESLYRGRGWRRWEGPTHVRTRAGVEPTPDDDGSIYVWTDGDQVDVSKPITCDWRAGDVW